MAKKKEINKSEKQARLDRVANCKQCNGNPKPKECNQQGLIFTICEDCYEIIGEYHKEGAPIKIKEKRIVNKHYLEPDFKSSGNEEVKEITPGKIDFSELDTDEYDKRF